MKIKGYFSTVLFFIVCIFDIPLFAMDLTLQWDTNSEKNLAGYKIFSRVDGQSYDYVNPAWEATIDELEDPDAPTGYIYDLGDNISYCFVVRAFNTQGEDSADSNEVKYVPISNDSPVADAGEDQEVYEGDTVFLTGLSSYDNDGIISNYFWEQIEGIPVQLSEEIAMEPNFTAPYIEEIPENLVFELMVTDNNGLQNIDTVTIIVKPLVEPVEIPGDINGNGVKDSADLAIIIANRGKPITDNNYKCDIDQDGDIDNYDVLAWRRL